MIVQEVIAKARGKYVICAFKIAPKARKFLGSFWGPILDFWRRRRQKFFNNPPSINNPPLVRERFLTRGGG